MELCESKSNSTASEKIVCDSLVNKVLEKFQTFPRTVKQQRNLISFWIFGLSTNFAFIVSLSAAQDITRDNDNERLDNDTYSNFSMKNAVSEGLICNPIGTGVILLSAVLPELVVKTLMQFSPKQLSNLAQVILTAFCIALSFMLLAFGRYIWLRIMGVMIASITVALGDLAFLSLTSFYHKNTVSAWASGTGAAGILGSLMYASFTSLCVSTQTFMLIMLVIPVGMILTFLFALEPEEEEMDILENDTKQGNPLSLKEKIGGIPPLLKYLVPLCFVYFCTYFINQGLLELLYFNNQILSREAQYRWYQVLYRIGIFVSRSSVNLVEIKRLWTLPTAMFVISALLICQVFFRFIPYLAIVMMLVLLEGLLNGSSYVNTFFCVTNELDSGIKEFALGFVASAGPMGILLAGVTSVPFHNYVCTLDLKV